MNYRYKTKGVCAREISFELNGGKVTNVSFENGCDGSLKGISELIDGMDADWVIEKTKNITCNGKKTSCPMQLAQAISEACNKETKNGI